MRDIYHRNINYMRISITDLCNLRCQYCMPPNGVPKKEHRELMTIEEILRVVKAGAKEGIKKIRITGGEPLIKRGILDLIQGISQVEGIEDISLTTNGILLKEMAPALKEAGLNRLNISMDSLRPDRFREITRGGDLALVWEGIREAMRLGIAPIKLNVVVIGNFNEDEINDFVDLTRKEPMDVRFIELMPLGEASGWAKERFISNQEIKSRIKDLIPIPKDFSGPAAYYKVPGAKGRIGFINPISDHFCSDCNRIRLTADGKLKPCLHSNHEISIKEVMEKEGLTLEEVIQKAILAKPEKHHLNSGDHEISIRNMVEIGG